ncbi:MAG: cyclophilin-like fold protein [Methylacidiphilaceae bacterium]|nr:cyclophilin-like fold protein [Candidatus Methylacidiphilaceae bacterium]
MPHPSIRITWKDGVLTGLLEETPTSEKLLSALPFTASAKTWGKEVYFSTPVEASLEADATDVVEPGTICYWVEGRSLALPYGPTPISVGSECRLVTRVNVVGKITGDPDALATIGSGEAIRIERAAT